MKYIFLMLLLLGITAKGSAQNLMLNGGFELQDGVAPAGSEPISIEYASYWHNLTGSCDLIPLVTGATKTGVGAGRLGVSPNGWTEFCYGSTEPLIAGHTYRVSFWIRKDYEPTNGTDLTYGLVISENLPIITTSPLLSSIQPLMTIKVEQTQYVRAMACFTPQNSVAHYVTIGPFGGNGTSESVLNLIDDVEVIDVTNQLLPSASISLPQSIYCVGDQVLLDGSASSNETEHEWKIYINGTQEIYSSGIINGTVGTFNAANHLQWLQPGVCYRAELTVYGVCKDVTSVNFCYANPNIDFIYDGDPVCENTPVDLQVTGDNGWTYTWSDGNGPLATGTGLKALTVTPAMGNGVFTVNVTTPEGCTHTETIHLNVNSHNNVAPWMDGINGTGEYTYYVSQGDAVFFNSVVFNDHLNEEIQYSNSNTIPGGFAFNYPSLQGGIFSFSWVTSVVTPVGEYHYYLTTNDRNSCGEGISTFDFRIIVVCDQCLVCVDHENRTPSGTPLPPETKAGKCIEAGMSQVVSTGDANVLFQAGVSITEGPYFEAGPGFEAVIDPTTCVTDCEDCCADWDGFHFDNPYYTIINLWDNDPTNDYFELTDFDHPFCSYGSKRFDLYIDDADDQSNYAHFSGGGYQCCMLQTRTPENPIPHSSIFWDGYLGGEKAQKQYYLAHVYLYDCNDEQHHFVFMISVTSLGSQLAQNNSGSALPMENTLALDSATETDRPTSESTANRTEELGIYPNPATNMLYISGSRSETTTIQLYDEKGRVLTKREKVALNQGYNLDAFSAGMYYCRIYKNDGSYVLKQFIKL